MQTVNANVYPLIKEAVYHHRVADSIRSRDNRVAITEDRVDRNRAVANRVAITEDRVDRSKVADNRVALTEDRVDRKGQVADNKVVTVLITRETEDRTEDLPYTIQGLTRKKLTQKKYRKK